MPLRITTVSYLKYTHLILLILFTIASDSHASRESILEKITRVCTHFLIPPSSNDYIRDANRRDQIRHYLALSDGQTTLKPEYFSIAMLEPDIRKKVELLISNGFQFLVATNISESGFNNLGYKQIGINLAKEDSDSNISFVHEVEEAYQRSLMLNSLDDYELSDGFKQYAKDLWEEEDVRDTLLKIIYIRYVTKEWKKQVPEPPLSVKEDELIFQFSRDLHRFFVERNVYLRERRFFLAHRKQLPELERDLLHGVARTDEEYKEELILILRGNYGISRTLSRLLWDRNYP